jgi:predicted O-linked N-acetylglucosamine transferase (SPINDLY family)
MYHEGHWERARAFCDRLIEMRPPNIGARFRKALSLPAIMASHDAIAETRERLSRDLDELEDASGVIYDPLREVNVSNFYLAYHGYNERDLQARVASLFRAKTPMLRYVAPHIGRARSGKTRVGVCSRHWGAHTIGVLFAELFARLDPTEFEVTCFHTATNAVALSGEFKQYDHRIVQLPLDLQRARDSISTYELDALVYPDIGMEPFTYFLAFSRLASKQVAMWGHPLTTGIPTIDCFLSARELEIEGAERHYTERLVKFANLNTYYRRPEADTRYNREYFGLQPQRTLYVCPQTLFKLHPDFDGMLADILTRDRNGDLILLEGHHVGHTQMLRERFERTLPGFVGRVKFLRRLSHAEYLGLLAITDVMLDPPHFGGGSTSLQALSFGTPIVTTPSQFARGRITAACYKAIGNEQLVAKDAFHYVDLACALGSDHGMRTRLRAELAEQSGVLYQKEAAVNELADFLRDETRGS